MSSSSLSIGVFFTLMIVGLSAGLPHTLQNGLLAHGVPASDPGRVSHLPPVATLFSSFLGYNPMATLLGPHVLAGLPAAQAHALTGRSFFPHLISNPFHTALVSAFVFAIVTCLVAAVASLLRGGKYHYVEATSPAGAPTGFEPVEPGAPGSSRQRVRSSNGSSTSSVHASTNSPSSPTSSPRSCARSASARPSSNGNDQVGDDDDIASHTKGGTDAHPLVRPIRVSDQR